MCAFETIIKISYLLTLKCLIKWLRHIGKCASNISNRTSCKLCPVAAMTSSVAEADASVRPLRVVWRQQSARKHNTLHRIFIITADVHVLSDFASLSGCICNEKLESTQRIRYIVYNDAHRHIFLLVVVKFFVRLRVSTYNKRIWWWQMGNVAAGKKPDQPHPNLSSHLFHLRICHYLHHQSPWITCPVFQLKGVITRLFHKLPFDPPDCFRKRHQIKLNK